MLRSLALAGPLLMALALPTLAEAATVSSLVHIRAGPGMKYPIIGLAWPGVQFNVHGCSRLWCKVSYFGLDGYISTGWINGGEGAAGASAY